MTELKEMMNNVSDNLVKLTKNCMDMCNCPVEECFPYYESTKVVIDGVEYRARIEVKLDKR